MRIASPAFDAYAFRWNGKLITESLKHYSRKAVRRAFALLTGFLSAWENAERRHIVLQELAANGVFIEELSAQVRSRA